MKDNVLLWVIAGIVVVGLIMRSPEKLEDRPDYKKGYEVGHDEGFQEGLDQGKEDGKEDGLEEGKEEGEEEGKQQGEEEGAGEICDAIEIHPNLYEAVQGLGICP